MKNILFRGLSLRKTFEAEVTAELMIKSNALIPTKLVHRLCGISTTRINRRVESGTFPNPTKLSANRKSKRKAFYLKDIHEWIKSPHTYLQPDYHEGEKN